MNKYKNQWSSYNGIRFRSKLEARYARQLDIMKKGRIIKDWSYEPTFDIKVNGQHVCKIKPDFFVVNKYNHGEIHEVKSPVSQTSLWRLKWKLMKILYPQYDYFIIGKNDVL